MAVRPFGLEEVEECPRSRHAVIEIQSDDHKSAFTGSGRCKSNRL